MKVLIYDKFKNSKVFKNVSLNYLAKKADVISLHVHLNDQTRHLIDKIF